MKGTRVALAVELQAAARGALSVLRSGPPVLISLGLVLLLVTHAGARDLRTASPRGEGLSPQRLERLTAHMNKAVDDGIMVGGLGMISRNGKIVYQRTYGLSDREAGTAMKDDSLFRIYSMTKPITAVALMMLYEEGRFFLNDPVAKYLPELADLQLAVSVADSGSAAESDGTVSGGTVSGGTVSGGTGSEGTGSEGTGSGGASGGGAGSVDAGSGGAGAGDGDRFGKTIKPKRQPTIRDLLRHTAGLSYGIFGDTEVDRMYRDATLLQQDTIAEFVVELGKIPLLYEPGTKWHYSVAVDVQGRLVEVLSGMRFGEFLEQRLFQPLGMNDTAFVVSASKRRRLARLYSPEGTDMSLNSVWQRSESTELVPADEEISRGYDEGSTFESGGGGLVSSAEDYMRFCLMMLNGGELDGARIISPKTVELMTRNHLGEIPMGGKNAGVGFGLGFAVALDPGQIGEIGSVGEYNWGGAAGTRFWIDPQERLIGLFMVQSIPHQTRLGQEFKVLTYQALID
jgi:CubicO group peptidase (beta-lactamase class C family)